MKGLEEAVGRLLVRKKLTLAVAESCTGGLITSRLTDVAGSSRYLALGVVAYADSAKTGFIGVPARLIRKHGAVSAPVAKAMARGVRTRARTKLGLAVTGIAGPGGGTRTKPVGLVYIAVAGRKGAVCKRRRFSGERTAIKRKSCQAALDLLRRALTE